MIKEDIEFFKSLDVMQEYGTLQGLLMDMSHLPFREFAKELVEKMMEDRETLIKDNIILTKIVVDNGLYTSENLGLE